MKVTVKEKRFKACLRYVLLFTVALIVGWQLQPHIRTTATADASDEDPDRYFKALKLLTLARIPPPVDLTLPDLSGRPVRLSDLKGSVVVLNFWTTWCPDCRSEMPSIETLHQRFKDRPLTVLAVDLRDPRETVRQFVAQYHLSFTTLLDSSGQVGRSFGVRSIPTTFIIDQAGGMVGKAIGPRQWGSETAAAFFDQLIKHPPGPVAGENREEK